MLFLVSLALLASGAVAVDSPNVPQGARSRPGFGVFDGACPHVQTIANFDLDKYLGLPPWWQIEAYPVEGVDVDCGWAVYTLNDDGSILVNNTARDSETGDYRSTLGKAEKVAEKEGKLSALIGEAKIPGKYWVLDTDYNLYSFVYSCTEVDGKNYQTLWILSRQQSLQPQFVAGMKDWLKRKGVHPELLKPTNQDPASCGERFV